MITEEYFIRVLKELEDIEALHVKIDAFVMSNDLAPFIDYPDGIELCIGILEEIFNDVDGVVAWYVFERQGDKSRVFENIYGEQVKFTDASELYKYLIDRSDAPLQ